MNKAIAYEAFRDALNHLKPGWETSSTGLLGPAGALVRLGQRHPSRSEGHVDVQFVLDVNSPTGPALWDCVTGSGATETARARFAAHLWAQTTAGVLLELKYSLRGEFADHYRGNDPDGFQGWHAICGAIMGYGEGESATQLQQWWLKNPILPTLSQALNDSLDENVAPYGIKIFFGGADVAEVRVNGERHDGASAALSELDWPRLQPLGFVRSYVVVLHREDSS
jgi:hypothetical protein